LAEQRGFENYDKLPDLQKNVYRLIVKRFLAIFYPPAEYNKVSVTIEVENGQNKEEFSCSGKVCLNQGYLEVLKGKSTESTQNVDKSQENFEDEIDSLTILAELKKGKEVDVINYETKEAQTNPPTRYNSGSMILAMENAGKLIEDEELREQIKGAGIGTSATRAEIMKKLERIQYIQINDKTQIITPTQKGEIIYDIVNNSMPDMLNPKLTASWEKGLDMVAKKEIQSDEFMGKLEKYIHSKFNRLVVKY
jgi:DNA topoisomerase-3